MRTKFAARSTPQGSVLNLVALSFRLGCENETLSNRSCGSSSFWRKFTANNLLKSIILVRDDLFKAFCRHKGKTRSHNKDCSNNGAGCTTEQAATSQIAPLCDKQTFVVLETKDHILLDGNANVDTKVGKAKE